jgi:hypothetical protein
MKLFKFSAIVAGFSSLRRMVSGTELEPPVDRTKDVARSGVGGEKVCAFAAHCAKFKLDPLDEIERMNSDCDGCGKETRFKRGDRWWCSEKCVADRIDILSNMP